MRFNPKARLDTSRVRDVGSSAGGGGGMGGGGMRIPIPGGTKAGGGIGGVIIIILFLVLTQCLNNGGTGGLPLPDSGLDSSRMAGTDTGRYTGCKTGADANNSPDCARVAVENSLYNYWSVALPEQSDVRFQPESMQTFSGGTSTGCGDATAEVGPFYCPTDGHDLPRHHLLRAGPPAAARRPVRRVRRALRARPRVRAPHPEPARHDGPGEDPAGPQQRRRPAGAAGRLLRRHVGQERHVHRHRRRRAAPGRPHRHRHPAGDRGGQGGRRRPDPAADHRPGQQGAVDPRLGRRPGCSGSRPASPRARCRPATRSRCPLSSDRWGQGWSRASISSATRSRWRRYGATLGCRNFAASAPSPPATRARAHSARLTAVYAATMRAPSAHLVRGGDGSRAALGQAEQVGVEQRFGGLARAGHLQPEVGADRPDAEALPVDRQHQVALAAAQVRGGHVAVVRDERERVVLLEEVLAARPQAVGQVGGAGAREGRPAAAVLDA